jgi:hypothetical protein
VNRCASHACSWPATPCSNATATRSSSGVSVPDSTTHMSARARAAAVVDDEQRRLVQAGALLSAVGVMRVQPAPSANPATQTITPLGQDEPAGPATPHADTRTSDRDDPAAVPVAGDGMLGRTDPGSSGRIAPATPPPDPTKLSVGASDPAARIPQPSAPDPAPTPGAQQPDAGMVNERGQEQRRPAAGTPAETGSVMPELDTGAAPAPSRRAAGAANQGAITGAPADVDVNSAPAASTVADQSSDPTDPTTLQPERQEPATGVAPPKIDTSDQPGNDTTVTNDNTPSGTGASNRTRRRGRDRTNELSPS